MKTERPPNSVKSLLSARRTSKNASRNWLITILLACTGLIAVAIAGYVPSTTAQKKTRDDSEKTISEQATRQINELMQEKESRSPAQQKIDSQLLYAIKMNRGEPITRSLPTLEVSVKIDENNLTVVDVVVRDLKIVINGLGSISSISDTKTNPEILNAQGNSIRVRISLTQIEDVASWPDVVFVNRVQEAKTNRIPAPRLKNRIPNNYLLNPGTPRKLSPGFAKRAERVRQQVVKQLDILNRSGGNANAPLIINVSEGDQTHNADIGRATYGARGQGIKIGVLSDGVTSIASAQSSGDLGPVTVLPGQTGSGDEGTAMLELVHDLAPDAELFFATAFTSLTSFGDNIRALRTAGCDIIIDDVIYFVETPMQDGQTAGIISTTNGGYVQQAVNDVTNAGALFFSSAGNSGNLNDGTGAAWEGDFVDGGANVLIPGGTVHNFGSGNLNNQILESGARALLFWSDPLGGSSNDYDLFVLNSAATAVSSSSSNIQNGTQDPVEDAGNRTSLQRLVVLKKTGAAARFLHLTTFGAALQLATSGTTHGHNQSELAYSVAATPADEPFCSGFPAGPFPNPFTTANKVECFSSDGPRRILYAANGTAYTLGNVSATGGVLRQKPDITAADGTAVSGVGGFPDPFYGTSAAAPHAGAIAALIKSTNPSLTAAQIRSALTSSALDVEAGGVDRDSGFGIIMADAALAASGATPQAVLTTGSTTLIAENGVPANSVIDPGETVTVSFSVQNIGGANTTVNTVGTLQSGGGVLNPSAPQNYGVIVAGGAVSRDFTFLVNPSVECGALVIASIVMTDGATNLGTLTFTLSTGALGSPVSFSYTGPPVSVPDSTPAGVNIPISVSGFTGNIGDVNFRIDGTSCSNAIGSTTVGMDHTWVGDLVFKLQAPNGGPTISIINRPGAGGGVGSNGNNFCQTLLDDDAAGAGSIGAIPNDGTGAPYTGTFTPQSPLSGFDGFNPNGTWTLNVSDNVGVDTGSVRAFTLTITAKSCIAPPVSNASVSGRVTANGRGVKDARVSMQNGGVIVHALTNAFGHYRFNNILTGQSYLMSVKKNRLSFTPRNVVVNGNLTGEDFAANP